MYCHFDLDQARHEYLMEVENRHSIEAGQSVAILSEGHTATTDYILLPYLQSQGFLPSLLDSRVPPPESDPLGGLSTLIISRYLTSGWKPVVDDFLRRGGKVVYFMDDDLFDVRVLNYLPWRYRWKIYRRALRYKHYLVRVCDEFWVSTPYLLEKYRDLEPRLLQPFPPPVLLEQVTPLNICYHGTASHIEEIAWLADVIRDVQSRSDSSQFELFGGTKVKKLYREIPRVSVIQPMTWPDYLAWSGGVRRDIALAPMISSRFNAGRGYTKFFDHVRIGAVGVYSGVRPYEDIIEDGVDGILLENDRDAWSAAIVGLLESKRQRETMAFNARRKALRST